MCAKRRKRRKSIILRLLVLGVAGYMLCTLAGLWNTLREDRAHLAELQNQLETSQLEVDELKNLLSEGSQSDIIEQAARERLGYVYADEEIYIDISGS